MDLEAVEREIYSDPPPEPPPELINNAMRALDGRFVSHIVPLFHLAETVSPVVALHCVVILRRKLAKLEHAAVEVARAAEWSWRDIGQMFGISASAAYRRYGRQ